MKTPWSPLLLAVALAALGCGREDAAGAQRTEASTRQAEAAKASVQLVDLKGLEGAIAARRGRALLLNFWALW
jgi:hypothetical protein